MTIKRYYESSSDDEGDSSSSDDDGEFNPIEKNDEVKCDEKEKGVETTKDSPYKVEVLDSNKKNIEQPHCCSNGLLPTLPTGILVIGKTGSGKSNACFSMLSNKHMLKDHFDFIYLFVGVKPDPQMVKILNIPPENIKQDFEEKEVKDLLEKLERTVEKRGMDNCPSVLLIFDDILGRPDFIKSKTMSKLVTTNRHCNVTYMILSQYFRKLTPVMRTNASYFMIFPSSMIELEKIAEELTPANMSKKEFLKVAQHATREKYQFLSINTKADPDCQLRKNFDTILNL